MVGAGDIVGVSPALSPSPNGDGNSDHVVNHSIDKKLACQALRSRRQRGELVSVCWPVAGNLFSLVAYNHKDSVMRIFGLSLTSIFVLFLVFVIGSKYGRNLLPSALA